MGRVPQLHVMELASGRTRNVFEGSGYELERAEPGATSFDISPDGQRIVFAYDPADEKRLDNRFALAELHLKSRRFDVIVRDANWSFGAPRYSPDGSQIAFLAKHDGLKHTMPDQLAVWDRASKRWEVESAAVGPRGQGAAAVGRRRPGAAVHRRAEGPHASVALRPHRPPRRGAGRGRHRARLRQARRHGGDDRRRRRSSGARHRVRAGTRRRAASNASTTSCWPPSTSAAMKRCGSRARWATACRCGCSTRRGSTRRRSTRCCTPSTAARTPRRATAGTTAGTTSCSPRRATWWRRSTTTARSSFGYAFLDSITHRWGELELKDIEAATDWLLRTTVDRFASACSPPAAATAASWWRG